MVGGLFLYPSIKVVVMCVGRGNEWLLERRAQDRVICPPGEKIEKSRLSVFGNVKDINNIGCKVLHVDRCALSM